MKKTISLLAALAIMAAPALALAQDSGKSPASPGKTQYTCTMHPEVVQDKPGDCPKCSMKLVEKKDDKRQEEPKS